MRRFFVMLGAAVLVAAGLVIPATAAHAADGATVTITGGEQSNPSGSDFAHTVSYSCSALEGDVTPCEDVVIKIPLAGLAAVPFTDEEIEAMISTSSPDATWSVVDGVLTVELGELEAGESASFPFTITPPNNITPDGTTWELQPTISGSNIPDATSDTVATDTATATLTHEISKTLEGTGFRQPGDTVEYDIVVQCTQPSAGNIFASSMTVTDTLPEGLVFDSADPQPVDAGANPLTWVLDPLPASCTTEGENGAALIHVVAHIDEGVAGDIEQIENVAGVTSETTDGQDIPEKTDEALVTLLPPDQAPGVGTFTKSSFAQLRDVLADGDQTEENSHTTYSGAWGPIRDTQPANVLNSYKPNEATGLVQSGYKMQYSSGVSQGSGAQVSIVDPMPCFTKNAVTHNSNAPEVLCSKPAFIPTTVSVWSSAAGVGEFDAAAYQPQARLADGSVIDLEHVGDDARNASTYRVPSGFAVAELLYPGDVGLSGQTIRWAVFGYVWEDVSNLSLVENTAHATVRWEGEVIGKPTGTASLRVINQAQTGIDKSFAGQSGGNANLRLTARLTSQSTATQDFVVTDLLPEGMTSTSVPGEITADVVITQNGVQQDYEMPADSIEVIPNYLNSGRELIRVTWTRETLSVAPGSIGLVTERMQFGVSVDADVPATYDNTAQVYYTVGGLSAQCQQDQPLVQEEVEAVDFNGNGTTDDRHCFATAAMQITPEPDTASFVSTKTVQGDNDDAPQSYPGIGTVGTDGGDVQFQVGWSNTGATTLSNPVVYDILPAIGDVGVGGTSAGLPRDSDFATEFVSVSDVSEGVEIAYSTAANPCRDEVYPDTENVGCEDDWSLTPPADAASVTALRAIGGDAYVFGEGFSFAVNMTVPTDIAVGDVAWNSIAANAQMPDESWMQPSAPPKVGVTAEAVTMIGKTLAPGFDASNLVPGDEVRYQISIANPSAVDTTVDATDTLPDELTFVSIDPALDPPTLSYDPETSSIRWEEYPIAARSEETWIVTATINEGVIGEVTNVLSSPGAVITTPPCEDDDTQTCVTVDVGAASIAVTKTVDGDAASTAPLNFTFQIVCTLDGDVVLDEAVVLAAGETSAAFDVPVGTECTVTETDSAGATSAAEPQVVQLDQPTLVEVNATNTFDAGYLAVSKTVSGSGADSFGQVEFTFSVSCTLAGQSVLNAEKTTVIGSADGAVVSDPIGPLPVGSECVVMETVAGGADAPAAPVVVTITEGTVDAPLLAEMNNVFSTGTVEVAKEVVGTQAAAHANDAFEVLVTCQIADANGALTTVFSGSMAVTPGAPAPVTTPEGEAVILPVGARCFATETDDGGADRVEISAANYASGIVVPAGGVDEPVVITIDVVNTFGIETVPPLAVTGVNGVWVAGSATLAGLLLALGATLLIRRRQHA